MLQQAEDNDWTQLVTVIRDLMSGNRGASLLEGLDDMESAIPAKDYKQGESAVDYNAQRDEAIKLASTDLRGAIERFEELRDTNPDNATAWEDLGTMRMNLELHTLGYSVEQTLGMFQKALDLKQGSERIQKNYELCKKHQVARDFYGKLEHNVLPIPQFPGNQSSDYLQVMIGNAFFIKDAIPADKLDFLTLDYLREHHGGQTVEYIAPEKEFQFNNAARCTTKSMTEALGLLERNERTYVIWNMKYRERKEFINKIGLLEKIPVDETWLDEIIPTDELRNELLLKTHWYQMLIGSKDAGMFNHRDGFENSGWHLHIRGSKRWHVCHPDNSMYIRKYTKNGAGETNFFSPNYESHPEIRKVVAYMGELSTGDILYYPGRFWHQTHNVQDMNITFTCSGVDKSNVTSVIGCMKSCCTEKLPYDFSRELCLLERSI